MAQFLDLYAQRHPELVRKLLTRKLTLGVRRLIIFLTPGYELRAGGVMTIGSFYRESIALRHIHQARVALCAVPGDPPFLKYGWFENRNYILDLDSVLESSPELDYFQLHIPDYAVNRVLEWLDATWPAYKEKVRELHLNVLLFNLECIEGQNVSGLKRHGSVSATTAHEAYTNEATRERLDVSVHRLSVCNGPELYRRSEFQDKEPILIVSHDEHPLKEQVLAQIEQAVPGLKIKVIQNMTYEEYKELIGRAKWSLTFGEGLDGYFVEPVFCGSIPFAVFNNRYFTPEFAELETVYPSWEVLRDRITTDIRRLDNPVIYDQSWRQVYDLVCSLYNVEQARENLREFYRGNYTFP